MSIINMGQHCVISDKTSFGENVKIGHNCVIEEDVVIGDNVFIDSNTVIRSGVTIGNNAFIGSNCVIGEYWMDFCIDRKTHVHPLTIGDESLIRSGSIIYAGSTIGKHFQTGHQVTIREKADIGDNVSIGTLSDIQGNCKIGNYVRLHSNVHIGQLSVIDDFVWIFPYVVLTNDPTPPSENFVGVHVHSFAIIATASIVMPGLDIGQDCLIGAGAIVTKSVEPYAVAVGNPAKSISDVRKVKNKITGEPVYPWRDHFSNYMPWDKIGFDAWYASLNLEEKKHYHISEIQ
jgi:acetyltransferase-like isoleucine patch superfamily enzyme